MGKIIKHTNNERDCKGKDIHIKINLYELNFETLGQQRKI